MDYEQKYIKYKRKYLLLKEQMGGVKKCDHLTGNNGRDCNNTIGCYWESNSTGYAPWGSCEPKHCDGRTHIDCIATIGCKWKKEEGKDANGVDKKGVCS
jgi:hypothetical protein